MGLLEGSGRGGKGADGTQREVHQRHVACQKSREGTEEGGGGEGWQDGVEGGRHAVKEGGEVRVRYPQGEVGEAAGTAGVMGSLGSDNDAGLKDGAVTFSIE